MSWSRWSLTLSMSCWSLLLIMDMVALIMVVLVMVMLRALEQAPEYLARISQVTVLI
jgi:hypothetical protein